MDALRNAKRFHVTVGFTTDTGLKDATDLSGSPLLFLQMDKADGYWQFTSTTK